MFNQPQRSAMALDLQTRAAAQPGLSYAQRQQARQLAYSLENLGKLTGAAVPRPPKPTPQVVAPTPVQAATNPQVKMVGPMAGANLPGPAGGAQPLPPQQAPV